MNSWKDIYEKKKGKPLVFIHTPKCGGTFVGEILKKMNIKNNEHNQALKSDDHIIFTVIREPIQRYESLLNYRLSEKTPRKDWPKRLSYVYKNTNISLNEIVENMTDNEILGFVPYQTLTYWCENVDIIITLEQFIEFLHFFGYQCDDINNYKKLNVSNKIRGTFDEKTKERLCKLYYNDIVLYNQIVNLYS